MKARQIKLEYLIDKDRFLFAGLGIVIWGLMNCVISHIAFTVIFL